MGKAIFTPEKTIKIEGKSSTGEKITLEFNKKDSTYKHDGGSSYFEQEKTPLFLKFFFFSDDLDGQKAPESFSKNLLLELSRSGIDVKKKTLTVIESTNEAGISIGKDKRFALASEFILYKTSFLPATLKLNKTTFHFQEYNKSIKPMVFPGRIDISEDGKVVETWTFYRKEFYLD